MSLYGALFGGVSGLTAQSSKIGAISDNIANVNTVGYKQAVATFSSLVVNSSSVVSYQTGGVRGGTVLDVSQQGLLQSTQSPTDLAISGNGFFVVRSVADGSIGGTAATPLYTRAGSFTPDALGNFVNTNGFFLQGWPLDRDGRLPGDPGNLDTTASSNFDSLKPVNIQSASGVAQGTTTIALGANLKSSEVVYPGASGLLVPDLHNSYNQNIAADQIQVGSEYGLATADSMRRGDTFNVTAAGGTATTYEYGGFTIGRQVTTSGGSVNFGDSGSDNTSLLDVSSGVVTVDAASKNTFIFTVPNHDMITGDTVTITGLSIPGVPSTEVNSVHTITRIDASHFSINTTTPTTDAFGAAEGTAGATANIRQFKGNVLDAITSSSPFFSLTNSSGYTASALTLQITTTNGGAKTFSYAANSPNTATGQFNSLNTLAQAIDATSDLTARVVDGRLVVAAQDANESVTFTNGDAVGNAAGTQRGIDWVQELGLAPVGVAAQGVNRYASLQGLADKVNASTTTSAKITNPLNNSTLSINVKDPLNTIQFSDATLANFSITAGNNIDVPAGIYTAGQTINVTINDIPPAPPTMLPGSPGSAVTIAGLPNGIGNIPGLGVNGGPFNVVSTTGTSYTIQIPVSQTTVIPTSTSTPAPLGAVVAIVGKSNQGSVLSTFGFAGSPATATNIAKTSLNGATYAAVVPSSTPSIGPEYDPTGAVGQNMASGDIVAQFSRNVTVYDSLGSAHDVRFSYIKTAPNTWAVEVHAIPATDINATGSFVDGQIATGSIVFNGDGTLHSVTSSLSNPIAVQWSNAAVPSTITLNLGTAGVAVATSSPGDTVGLTDGLSQFDSAYNVNFANQNGAPVGELTSVAVDKDGIVTASYSNGQTQKLFKIPLASFANPDGLDALSGNVYSQTRASGEVNLREAGNNGTGSVVSAALESSNVDLAEQLTDIIVAQRSYQANTKVIKTADDLLNELNQL